jgi:hypothetical protein
MPEPFQVPWSSVREGNRVIRRGQARRVVIVTRAENSDVAVLFDDGSREFHVGEEPTQLLVERSTVSASRPADSGT